MSIGRGVESPMHGMLMTLQTHDVGDGIATIVVAVMLRILAVANPRIELPTS